MQNNPKPHKKSIIVAVIVMIIVAIVAAALFFYFKPKNSTSTVNTDSDAITSLNIIDVIGQSEADRAYDEAVETQLEQYPIVDPLPIIADDYRIDYGECNSSDAEFCIFITANSDESKTAAMNALRALPEYNDDYIVEFIEK